MERNNLRIEEIMIEGLFNTFNYKIPLNLDDRITIIYGSNGYGKTTILNLLFELFSGNPSIFYKIPFLRIRITYVNKMQLLIERRSFVESPIIDFSIPTDPNIKPFDLRVLVEEREFLNEKQLRSIFSTLTGYEKGLFQRKKEKKIRQKVLLDEFTRIRMARDRIVHGSKEDLDFTKRHRETEWFVSDIKLKTQVEFIRTDRLFTFIKPDQISDTIIKFSTELVEIIQEVRNQYNDLTISIDRSFPFRLIKGSHFPPKQSIQELLEDLEKKRSNLSSVGLIDQEKDPELFLNGSLKISNDYQFQVLFIYVEDAKRKLEVFDLILNKINLFRRIINNRLQYKKLYINKKRGFVIKTPDGKELSLKDLSSGEKHQIIIIYELIFNTEPNNLVLIDEPEISLHVDWQDEFIPDILEVAKLNNLDILIATHSPTIIGDRWDLTVPLEGPESQ